VPDTPVTLKFRTGWNRDNRNAPRIARIAEESGIRAIAIHGRTRADQYMGEAEYDTIALVKSQVKIPVIANGDINTPQKARFVLDYTGADGVMIGRAAQGKPWLFREIEHFLATGELLAPPVRGRDSRHPARPPGRTLWLLRRGDRRAHRAQAHQLVHQGPGRRGALPPRHEPAADGAPATGRRRRCSSSATPPPTNACAMKTVTRR
jgi:hypothetical protein